MRADFTSLVPLALVAIVAMPAQAAPLDLNDDVFQDSKVGIRFAAPTGWSLTRHTGYSELLAILTRHGDPVAQINVAMASLPANKPLSLFVRDNNLALGAVGFTVHSVVEDNHLGRKIWRATISSPPEPVPRLQMRQLYVPVKNRVFVLTLITDAAHAKQNLAALDDVMQSLRLTGK